MKKVLSFILSILCILSCIITVSAAQPGDMIFCRNFGGSDYDYYKSVAADVDGYVAVGNSYASSFGNGDWSSIMGKGGYDAIIVKYNLSGNVVWKKNFGGTGGDFYESITAVSDGYVAAGRSASSSFGNGDWKGVSGKGGDDAIIVKYDLNGNIVWKKSFGGTGWDQYDSITTVPDGYVAVGNSSSIGNGDWSGVSGKGGMDAIIVKYDLDGNIIWKKNFGGIDIDRYTSVTASDDGYVSVGYSYFDSFGNGDWKGISGKGSHDAIIVKYDLNGNIIWKKNFGGKNYDQYNSITASDDGYAAVGSSYDDSFGNGDWSGISGKGNKDAIIVKYDLNGNVVWKKNFGGSQSDWYGSVIDAANGYIAVGGSSSINGDLSGISGKGEDDAIIVKYDLNGNVVWKKKFGGSDMDQYYSVTLGPDGYIAVGYSYPSSFGNGDWAGVSGKGNRDAIIVKYVLDSVIPSSPSGLYESAVNLNLRTDITGAEIYYTTDGSEPSDLSEKYTSPIYIGKTAAVKTIMKYEGALISPQTFNYYIFDPLPSIPLGPLKTDVMKIAQGESGVVRLSTNGTVSSAGAENWRSICDIAAGKNHMVGLRLDGTLISSGDNSQYQRNVTSWKNVRAVTAGAWHTAALLKDGKVASTVPKDFNHNQGNTGSWENIVSISAGYQHTVGLKSDGTVVAVGDNSHGQCDVSDWKDIVKISAGSNFTVGIKRDWTVVAVGNNSNGQLNVGNWQGIESIYAGNTRTIGIKYDGSIITTDNLTVPSGITRFAEGYIDSLYAINPSGSAVNGPNYNTEIERLNKGPAITNNLYPGTYNFYPTIELSTAPGYDLLYTIDGSDPKSFGMRYTQPFKLSFSTTLRIIAKKDGAYMDEVSYTYDLSNSDDPFILSVTAQQGEQAVKINTVNKGLPITDAVIITSLYDSKGKLYDLALQDVYIRTGNDEFEIPLNKEYTSAEDMKIMVWNKNMQPYSVVWSDK